MNRQKASSNHRLELVVVIVLAIALLGVMLAVSAVLVGVVRVIGSGK
jgi:hypothetical protein